MNLLSGKKQLRPNWLFRVIVPRFPPHNVYKYSAKKTTSLGAVMVATVAKTLCGSWLEAEEIDENNYRIILRRAPKDKNGLPNHLTLQQERKAAIVAFSCGISVSAPRCLELIKFYKNLPENLRPKAIIAGGWHALDNPLDFLEAGADVVVHGEGEPILEELLTALRGCQALDSIPGISYWSNGKIKRNSCCDLEIVKQIIKEIITRGGYCDGQRFLNKMNELSFPNGSSDLEILKRVLNEHGLPCPIHFADLQVPQEMMDSLPDPDFGLVRYAKIKLFPVGRTRGCSGRCRFCRVRSTPRSISPERFLQQLIVLVSKGVRSFFIVDDRSEEDLAGYLYWLKGLAQFRRERRLRLNLATQNRLSLAEHPEVLEAMQQAGVEMVAIGYESPIAEELRAMRKPINPAKMLGWTKVWKKFGFWVHAMFIFGYPMPPGIAPVLNREGKPMSAKQKAKIFWQFIRKTNPDTLQVLLFTPAPGTEDRKDLEKENRILPLGWEFYDGTWLVFKPDEGIKAQELQQELIKLMRKFYAFHYIWQFGIISLVCHLLKIGLVTISLPFVWPLTGFQPWHQVWRNAKRRYQGHLVILAWLKNFKRLHFTERLAQIISKKQLA